MVAAVEVVATEVDDVVVDSDAVEMLEIADLAEDTDIFFLALLDCMGWMNQVQALSSRYDKTNARGHNSR